MAPIVFLSDFGLKDPYVAQVKGVIAKINPHVQVIDLTHDVSPQDIIQAAFILGTSYPYFPEGSIFLSVVDPGVGSDRKCIVMQAGPYPFVAPDNGLLTMPYMQFKGDAQCRVIENSRFFRKEVSPTFHGRDIMGPVAAHLSLGEPVPAFGPEMDSPQLLNIPEPEIKGLEICGVTLFSDRFGNVITNIHAHALESLIRKNPNAGGVAASVQGLTFPLKTTYSSTEKGKPLALQGSSGYLELAVNQGSAAAMLPAHAVTGLFVSVKHDFC